MAICALYASGARAGWVEATTSPFNPVLTPSELSLAIVGGVPHIAYSDAYTLHAKKLVAGNWVALGGQINTYSLIGRPATLIEYAGQPCLIHIEVDESGSAQNSYVWVKCWDGTAWQPKGPPVLAETDTSSYPSDACIAASGSTLAVAVVSYYGGLRVFTWSGTSWDDLGTPGQAIGAGIYTESPILTLNGATPFVGFGDYYSGPRPTFVAQGTGGTSWTKIFESPPAYDRIQDLSYMLGALHMVHEGTPLYDRRVKVWAGGASWNTLGGSLFTGSDYQANILSTDGAAPYLFYTTGYGRYYTRRLVSGAWAQLPGIIQGPNYLERSVAFDGPTPYVVWIGGDVRLSSWQAGAGMTALLPNADRPGTTEWFNLKTLDCTPVSTNLYDVLKDVWWPGDYFCTPSDGLSQYVQSADSPTPANVVGFELTDAPLDLQTATGGTLYLHVLKSGGKTASVLVSLRRADGTLLTSWSPSLSTTGATLRLPLGPISLTKAEVDGLYVEFKATVTGGGSATAVLIGLINLNLDYTEPLHSGPRPLTARSPTGPVATQTPTLSAVFNDPDMDDVGRVTFYVCTSLTETNCQNYVYSSPGGTALTGSVTGVPVGGAASWTTPTLNVGGTYYWAVRSEDRYGLVSELSDFLSFNVTAGTTPLITDNQSGDDTWRSANSGTYDVDFSAPLGLAGFDVRVYSGTSQTGTLLQDWVQVGALSGTSSTANWALPASTWNAMQEGTNYVSVRLRDATAQQVTRVDTFYVRKDTLPPSVSLTSPAAGAFVNLSNQAAFVVGGACSENGRAVSVTGGASVVSATCTNNAWSAVVDLSAASQGAVTVSADHQDAAGNTAPSASQTFTKDTVAPTVAISTPAPGTFITSDNQASFTFGGSCSENGRSLSITGAVVTSTTCTGNAWSVTVDVSAETQGPLNFNVDHQDAAGNSAQATQSFTKDTVAPTVAFTSPAPAAYVTPPNQAAFAVGGSCSDDGRTVSLSGAATASALCTGGSWSATVDLTAAAEGALTLLANFSDAAGNVAVQASLALTKDVTPPALGLVRDGPGADLSTQLSTTVLEANWDAFVDPQSGVVVYAWAIGTAAGLQDIQPFTSTSLQMTATASGLALVRGRSYFIGVRATNGAGLSAVAWSDGVLILDGPVLVREANDRAAVGVPYRYNASGRLRTSAGAPATFESCGGPPELVINSATGAVEWTPTGAGTTTVCVRAFNASGDDLYSFNVLVVTTPPPPPIARAEATPSSPYAPTVVAFDGLTSSADASALPLMFAWSPGDGSGAEGFTGQWSHAYPVPAPYTASLTVFDAFGQSSTATVSLDLRRPLPRPFLVGCSCGQSQGSGLPLVLAAAALLLARRPRRSASATHAPRGAPLARPTTSRAG